MTLYSFSRTKEEAKTYRKGWAETFGQYQGSIFLVPSETQEIIVQCNPYIRISCVLPAATRELRFSYFRDENKVLISKMEFPSLLLSQLIYQRSVSCRDYNPCFCHTCVPEPHLITCLCETCKKLPYRALKQYYIFQYAPGPPSSIRCPYFSNVEKSTGKICFGDQRTPSNLRQANNNFWGSTFNNDLYGLQLSHDARICNNKDRHSLYGHDNKHRGIFCRREIKHRCNCSCPNKDMAHQVGCHYRRYNCDCPCSCECCRKQCKCACPCDCCRKYCTCFCRCDLNQDFAADLQSSLNKNIGYQTSMLDILGTQHLTSKMSEGVFISDQAQIIKKIDSAFHKTRNSPYVVGISSSFVVGFVRAAPDHEWEVTFEDGQVMLFTEKEIMIS